jgi:N6-L-threonylcarbamoyladenine synthase
VNILAIESSCDETSAAILTENDNVPALLSNIVSSQIDIHKEFGGVVPEVAARAHIENIIPVIKQSLSAAKLTLDEIDYIGLTAGPGLVGSLVVGVETAKAISEAKNIPLVPLNHLEGHIYANFVEEKPEFPLVTLLVSGGHSMLIYMPKHLDFQIIGNTRDDAAGEAFDKAAKILGLGYPGGPAISKAAESGDENAYKLPIIDLTAKPERNDQGFLVKPELSMDFSFSGLKTALITQVKKIGEEKITAQQVNDLAASFQKAVIECLVQNSLRAVEKYKPKTFILSGGVAANKKLRGELGKALEGKCDYLIPPFELCTDNAGMIAAATYYHIKNGDKGKKNFTADPNMKL